MNDTPAPEKIRKGDGKRQRGNRSGFTTGACAAAAARAATLGLCSGAVPATVVSLLPNGNEVSFAVTDAGLTAEEERASCGQIGGGAVVREADDALVRVQHDVVDHAEAALEAMRRSPSGKEAARIGTGTEGTAQVALQTRIGGRRLLGMLEGAQLPRIC